MRREQTRVLQDRPKGKDFESVSRVIIFVKARTHSWANCQLEGRIDRVIGEWGSQNPFFSLVTTRWFVGLFVCYVCMVIQLSKEALRLRASRGAVCYVAFPHNYPTLDNALLSILVQGRLPLLTWGAGQGRGSDSQLPRSLLCWLGLSRKPFIQSQKFFEVLLPSQVLRCLLRAVSIEWQGRWRAESQIKLEDRKERPVQELKIPRLKAELWGTFYRVQSTRAGQPCRGWPFLSYQTLWSRMSATVYCLRIQCSFSTKWKREPTKRTQPMRTLASPFHTAIQSKSILGSP